MIDTFIYLILLCSWKVGSITKNTNTRLHETLKYTPTIFSKWISKPRRQRHKKCHKTNHGARKFSQNLRASKKLCYNERNYKSERHSRQHTFAYCKSQNKNTSTNNPNQGLEIQGRNKEEIKLPTPCRHNQMICTIHRCQNANRQEPTNINQPSLAYNELDLCNDYISKKEPKYNDCFCINFPCHCVIGNFFRYQSAQQCGFMERSSTTNQEIKEYRPTQIETKETNKQ